MTGDVHLKLPTGCEWLSAIRFESEVDLGVAIEHYAELDHSSAPGPAEALVGSPLRQTRKPQQQQLCAWRRGGIKLHER